MCALCDKQFYDFSGDSSLILTLEAKDTLNLTLRQLCQLDSRKLLYLLLENCFQIMEFPR